MSAHHGSCGKRNHHGNRDGDRERHREFAKQAAHDASHQKQGNEHRDQRNADGKYGRAHFLRAFQRGFERMQALFQITRDILDHDNCVVDHKTGRDGQRHQRKIVEAVAQQIHHAECSHQRHGDRDAGNEGRPRVSQENENDQNHQHHRDDQRPLGVVHGRADGDRLVHGHLHIDRMRNRGLNLRKDRLDAIHRIDDVRAGLAEDDDQNGWLAVRVAGITKVFHGILRLRRYRRFARPIRCGKPPLTAHSRWP